MTWYFYWASESDGYFYTRFVYFTLIFQISTFSSALWETSKAHHSLFLHIDYFKYENTYFIKNGEVYYQFEIEIHSQKWLTGY